MMRQTVYRYEERRNDAGTFQIGINVNDEIGLDPFVDYTLLEHLENLRNLDVSVIGVNEDVYTFSDGSQQILQQREEEIETRILDPKSLPRRGAL